MRPIPNGYHDVMHYVARMRQPGLYYPTRENEEAAKRNVSNLLGRMKVLSQGNPEMKARYDGVIEAMFRTGFPEDASFQSAPGVIAQIYVLQKEYEKQTGQKEKHLEEAQEDDPLKKKFTEILCSIPVVGSAPADMVDVSIFYGGPTGFGVQVWVATKKDKNGKPDIYDSETKTYVFR